MENSENNNYKTIFKSELDKFTSKLKNCVSTENGEWTVKGFIDIYKNIYTISADTKIISKILEIHIFPQILQFADSIGYKIMLAEKQNWYPDITLINKENEAIKFAVDIKTTYRDSKTGKNAAGFTLGSHGTYFKERDNPKNIQFPYSLYTGHYVLGIIYTRVKVTDSIESDIYQVKEPDEEYKAKKTKIGNRDITTVENLKSITSVIKDFDFFAAEKWKIASDGQGSGNTANIGSIVNIDDLKNERGTFSNLGEDWFDDYWINYGKITIIKNGKTIKITKLTDYLEFKNRKDLFNKFTKLSILKKK